MNLGNLNKKPHFFNAKQAINAVSSYQQTIDIIPLLLMTAPFPNGQYTKKQNFFMRLLLLLLVMVSNPVALAAKVATTNNSLDVDHPTVTSSSAMLFKAMQFKQNPQCDLFPDYEGLSVIDITHENKQCVDSKPWKVCDVFEKTYYLKPINNVKWMLKDIFNKKLATENMGITVPITYIFHDKYLAKHSTKKTAYFIASEAVQGFVSKQDVRTRDVIKKIGDSGVAKFAVANTFFYDLCDQNWGYNQDGLVLIDLDDSPNSLEEYFNSAFRNSNRLTYSLVNLHDMLAIYGKMQSKPVPQISHHEVMSQLFYFTLLDTYFNATRDAIKFVNDHHPNLEPKAPDIKINMAFTNKLQPG